MSIPSVVSTGRRLIGTTFLDRAIVADRTEVRDNRGGVKVTWIDRGTPQECRFVALTEEVPAIATDQGYGVASAIWLAPLGTKVRKGDRVTNLADSRRWIVVSVLTPPSVLAISERCGIREAEKGEAN